MEIDNGVKTYKLVGEQSKRLKLASVGVSSGVRSGSVTATSGNTIEVLSGGTFGDATAGPGGTVQLDPGASAATLFASSAGLILLYGKVTLMDYGTQVGGHIIDPLKQLNTVPGLIDSGVAVFSGTTQPVSSSIVANSQVAAGDTAYVLSGGTLSDGTVSGSVIVFSSGVAAADKSCCRLPAPWPGSARHRGTSVQERGLDRIDYVHVELASCDVLLAEGAASESYLEDDNRREIHNAPEWTGDTVAGDRCVPRVYIGAQLEAIRRRLAGVIALAS